MAVGEAIGWLLQTFGVKGVSISAIVALVSIALGLSHLSDAGTVAYRGVQTGKAVVVILIVGALLGVISIHPERIAELWHSASSIDWSSLLEAMQ